MPEHDKIPYRSERDDGAQWYIVVLTGPVPYEQRDRAHGLKHIDEFFRIGDSDYAVPLEPDEVDDLRRALMNGEISNLAALEEDAIEAWPEEFTGVVEQPVSSIPEAKDLAFHDAVELREKQAGIVAVLDQGRDRGFPLTDRIVYEKSYCDGAPDDARAGNDHGVHCLTLASLCGGKLINCRVFPTDRGASRSSIAAAIRDAADHGATVISMSLSGTGQDDSTYKRAADYAWTKNRSYCIAAAGNHGTSQVHYPAGVSNIAAVSAYGGDDKPAPFTAYGSHIFIAADGVAVHGYGLGGSHVAKSGTSMACPHVAAIIGALADLHPKADIWEAVADTARKPKYGSSSYYGFGIIQGDAALQSLGTPGDQDGLEDKIQAKTERRKKVWARRERSRRLWKRDTGILRKLTRHIKKLKARR